MMLSFLLQNAFARPLGDPAIRARKTHVSLSTPAMSLAHASISVMFGPATSFTSHMAYVLGQVAFILCAEVQNDWLALFGFAVHVFLSVSDAQFDSCSIHLAASDTHFCFSGFPIPIDIIPNF
jgi:hypothetical protein